MKTRNMNDLSIVVLNYNSLKDTQKCVRQLLSFNSSFHIIIVDNLSTDNSWETLKKQFLNNKKISLLQAKKNLGYNAGNNIGIRFAIDKCSSTYIGILNPDVIIRSLFTLENLVQVLNENKEIGLVSTRMLWRIYDNHPKVYAWDVPNAGEAIRAQSLIFKRSERPNNNQEILKTNLMRVDCVPGAFFIIKSAVLEKIHLFDEGLFLYNEENILGIQLKNLNYLEAVVLDDYFTHNHYSSSKKMTLKEKVFVKKNSYESTKYLLKNYYSSSLYLLSFLFIIEFLNRCCLFLTYLKNHVKESYN